MCGRSAACLVTVSGQYGKDARLWLKGCPSPSPGRRSPRSADRMTDHAPGRESTVHAAGVLADRIAAALVPRERGWRLPRRSALARRYNVSLTEIDAAIAELGRRPLVRR